MTTDTYLVEAKSFTFCDAAGDYSDTNNGFGTTNTGQITLASLAASTGYRQSAKIDLSVDGSENMPVLVNVRAAFEMDVAPTAGTKIVLYMAYSESATAGTGNDAGASGTDADYAGYSTNAAEAILQAHHIGTFTVTPQIATTVQRSSCGAFIPKARYGSLIVHNDTDQALEGDDVEMAVRLALMVPEFQA